MHKRRKKKGGKEKKTTLEIFHFTKTKVISAFQEKKGLVWGTKARRGLRK